MKRAILLGIVEGFFLLTTTACSEKSFPEIPVMIDSIDTIPIIDTANMNKPESDTIHYLALGDSYTIGESVKKEETYPMQLTIQLQQAGINIAEPTIIARTGWTTRQLKQALQEATLRKKYELVSLLIGVNNQYRGMDIEIYKTEFRELLKKAIELAGDDRRRVVVLSIPDYAYTPFGRNSSVISKEIDKYNDINLNISWEYNVSYFDITPISRMGLAQTHLVAEDGLHPSGKMYEKWVQLMLPEILPKLK